MRKAGWIIWIGALMFAFACAPGQAPVDNTGNADVVIHDNVRLLEDHPAFVSASLEENRIVYEFSESVADLDVATGDVVVGQGYLRRIEGVTRDGNLLVVDTSLTAFLFDVFQRAKVNEVIGPQDVVLNEGPYGQLQQPVDLTISIPFGGIKLELGTDAGSGASVEFLSGSEVRFGPSIVWVLDWETPAWYLLWDLSRYELNEFKIGLRGQFDLTMDIKWTVSQSCSAEATKKLFDQGDDEGLMNRPAPEYPFNFMIGPIPVRVSIVFNVEFGASLTATGAGTGQFGFDTHAMIEPGVSYTGSWTAYFDTDFSANMHDPTASSPEATLKVTAKVWAKPIITMELYEIGGPTISLDVYLEAVLELLPEFCFSMTFGVDAAIGVAFSGTIADLLNLNASFSRSFSLYSKELVQTCQQTGNLEGQIVIWNTDPDVPIPGATIDIFKEYGTKIEPTLTSAADGSYSKEGLEVGNYNIHVEKEGYLPADVAVEVKADQTVYVTELKAITDACDAPGTASGDVVDATNNNGIAAHLDFRAGLDMRTGDIVASTDCAADGTYSVSGLDSGHYTAHAQLDGYADAYFNVIVCGIDDGDPNNDEVPDQRGIMSPLEPGNWRIMLSWGERPNDLDLHCLTPGGRHIFFRDVVKDGVEAHCRGSRDAAPWVALDVDQTSGYGPETLTFTQFDPGTYTVFVHNYGAQNDHEYPGGTYADESTPFSSSQAKIRIYNGQNEEVEAPGINVPSSGGGYFWQVLTINGSTQEVSLVNSMGGGENPHDFIAPVSCLE